MTKLSISPEALANIELQAAWLAEHFSQSAKTSFLADVAKAGAALTVMPELGKLSPQRPATREWLANKTTRLYYQYAAEQNEIEVLAVVDTRRDPGRSGG